MKIWSNSSVIGEIKIKVTARYHVIVNRKVRFSQVRSIAGGGGELWRNQNSPIQLVGMANDKAMLESSSARVGIRLALNDADVDNHIGCLGSKPTSDSCFPLLMMQTLRDSMVTQVIGPLSPVQES